MALPNWLEEVPNMNFDREKHLLLDIQQWAQLLGWTPAPTAGVDFSERQNTDVALQKQDQVLRIAVQPKSKESHGVVRLQAIPTFKDAEFVWKPRKRKWEIEIGAVPMDRYADLESFSWLLGRLFAR